MCVSKQDSMITTTQIQIRFYVIATKKTKFNVQDNPYLSIFQKSKTIPIKMSKYSEAHTKSIKIEQNPLIFRNPN